MKYSLLLLSAALWLATPCAVLAASAPATAYLYDVNNQLSQLTDSSGRQVSYSYDDMGNLTAIATKSDPLTLAPVVIIDRQLSAVQYLPLEDYSILLARTEGVTGYGAVGLPAGLKLNSGSSINADGKAPGVIYGRPTVKGSFKVQLTARNAAGSSAPATLLINIANPFSNPISIAQSGQGKLTGPTNSQLLALGMTYTLTAVPNPGMLFSNWTGTLPGGISTSNPLTFILQSNMLLRANFVTNPFIATKGAFNGLFAAPFNSAMERQEASSGFLNLQLSDKGGYTATLLLGSASYNLSGQFDVAGHATKTFAQNPSNTLTLNLALDLTPGAERLTGMLANSQWQASLSADRAVFNTVTKAATQFMGKYTLVIGNSFQTDDSVPQGYGYLTLSVDGAALVTASGYLADGTLLTPKAAPISKNGQWPLFASLPLAKGSLWGWINFDSNQPPAHLHGNVSWLKPTRLTDTSYPKGFTNVVQTAGSRYLAPTTNRVVQLTNAWLSFEAGGLSAPFTNQVVLTSKNLFSNASPNALTLTLTPLSGLLNGTVTPPGAKTGIPFKGVLYQNANGGYGYFLRSNLSGSLYLEPKQP